MCLISKAIILRTPAVLAAAALVMQSVAEAKPANGWDESRRGDPLVLDGARLVFVSDFRAAMPLRGPLLWAGQHADFGAARFDGSEGYAYEQRDGQLILRAYRAADGVRGGNVQSVSARQAYDGAVIVPGKRGFVCAGCYWEARIRFPRARGTWGGFWLLTPDNPKRRGHLEVDVIEYYGLGDARGHHHSLHVWNSKEKGGHRSFGDYTGMDAIADFGWHRYGVDLRGKAQLNGHRAAVIYMDGIEVARTVAAANFFEDPFYFLMTATIANKSRDPLLPQSVSFDEVRVWK